MKQEKHKKFFNKKKKNRKGNDDKEINDLKSRYDTINSEEVKYFTDFPISSKTLKGLKNCKYRILTEIQKRSIGTALQGHDILGAAVTGSGKTLAFLIPVLENLFIKKWSRMDGVGAIIISPTRELAYQIFETLRKVGAYHDFSAGLIIGGKNLKFERQRMDQCNIIICTPGRLLQHMDENPLFNTDNMQILVLDEADRCLDLGFEKAMNSIIENFPKQRQTLLFSATQTKSVKDLARLSLENPSYIAPHEQQEKSTPQNLKQNYVVVNLEDKITMIWSFIKNHLKQKTIVFMSSCKQVKYIYEIFCKLRPGISLLALYGRLHQDRRVAVYNEFSRKSNVVLFATDIASRGLDFPIVNWVIQLDCPEDVAQYIHRAGRTARHNARGESLLVLMPSEEDAMLEMLKEQKIEINKIAIDPKKLFSPRVKMEAYLAQIVELKETAQRAFISYLKSVYLMKNKNVFKVEALDFDAYAKSLGLALTPRIHFLERLRKNKNKLTSIKDDGSNNNKIDLNEIVYSDDELFTVKRKNHEIEASNDEKDTEIKFEGIIEKPNKQKVLTKAAIAKRVLKKKIISNKKIMYNEEGEQIIDPLKQLQSTLGKEYEKNCTEDDGGINIENSKLLLQEEDKFDKERFRQKLKIRRREKKNKIKQQKLEDNKKVDDFGSDSDVDLSWVPDPDNIYGKNSAENDSEENKIHKPPKNLYEVSKKKKRKNHDAIADSNIETNEIVLSKKPKIPINNLSVADAEMLAMKLLNKD